MNNNNARNVYLAIKGDIVVHHTDLGAMMIMEGIRQPDMTITEEEFERAGGLARVLNGEIFLGKTAAEKTIEANRRRIDEIDRELQKIDVLSVRSARAVAYAFVVGKTPSKDDVEKVKEYEQLGAKLRQERTSLSFENEKLSQ